MVSSCKAIYTWQSWQAPKNCFPCIKISLNDFQSFPGIIWQTLSKKNSTDPQAINVNFLWKNIRPIYFCFQFSVVGIFKNWAIFKFFSVADNIMTARNGWMTSSFCMETIWISVSPKQSTDSRSPNVGNIQNFGNNFQIFQP